MSTLDAIWVGRHDTEWVKRHAAAVYLYNLVGNHKSLVFYLGTKAPTLVSLAQEGDAWPKEILGPVPDTDAAILALRAQHPIATARGPI